MRSEKPFLSIQIDSFDQLISYFLWFFLTVIGFTWLFYVQSNHILGAGIGFIVGILFFKIGIGVKKK